MTDINSLFKKHNLFPGRMISWSKSTYRRAYPNNIVVFNANIIVKSLGKIWYGDLDITLDHTILRAIAKELNETLYVLYEMDCRFETEKKPIDHLIKMAIWCTDDEDVTNKRNPL